MPKRYAVSTEKWIYNEIQFPKVTFLLDMKTNDVCHGRMHQANQATLSAAPLYMSTPSVESWGTFLYLHNENT